MEEPRFFSKDAWKGVSIAIIAVVVGQLVLAWQYYRLEEKRLPIIEGQLAEQREELERSSAKETLVSFLDAWQEESENLARRFLTENSVLQEEEEAFSLKQGIFRYKILQLEKVGGNEYRAQVEIQTSEELLPQVEILRLLKILDSYFVDSLEIAG
jgi:hypothetical protein